MIKAFYTIVCYCYHKPVNALTYFSKTGYISLLFIITFFTTPMFASSPDTVNTIKQYTKKQLNEDVRYLTNTIANVHPNMYHSIGKQPYQQLTDSVLDHLHDGMSERQAWPMLARLVGALNEGHSTFNYPDSIVDQLKGGGSFLFPVLVQEFDGTNFIVRADASTEDKLKQGDQITRINGIATSKLVDLISTYTGGLKQYKAIDVCRNLIVYLYLYNINGPYHINYIRNGKPDSALLNTISWAELRIHMAAKAKTLTKQPELPDYSFNYLNPDKAYLAINSLTAAPDVFKHFLDSMFTMLKNKPAKALIIDLRRNGGGNSALGKTLLGYITDKPFRMAGGVKWKVSQEYKNELNKRLKGEGPKQMAYYFNAANGTLLESGGDKPEPPAKNQLRFTCKVLVLIGPHTFSSANMLANTIQDYKLATLIGENSGEPANDYGELIFIKLPNTGLNFTTSTKQFVRANGNANDQHPVVPNITVVNDPLTPADEVLDFALRYK